MSETYPRYSVSRSWGDGMRPWLVRVSEGRARPLMEALAHDEIPFEVVEYVAPPRFRIKVAKHRPSVYPIKLADRERPAFVGQYRTIEAACRAMDNIVRRERGWPDRVAITPAEVRERMSA